MKSNHKIYLIFVIIQFLSHLEINGQNQYNMAQIIYQQKLSTYNLQFVISDQPEQCSWNTVLLNTVNNKELILNTDSIVKNGSWKHYESIGEAPQKLYNIGGAMLDDKNLYILYSRMGVVTLYKYHFVDSIEFKVTQKKIQSYFSLPTYGNMTCNAHFQKIGSCLFVSLCTGQTFIGKISTTLYRIDLNTFEVKEVEFNPNPTVVCAIYITDDTKRWMNTVKTYKDDELSQRSIEDLIILHQHSEQPYYFKKLDADIIKRDKQISQYSNLGFDLLSFWKNEDRNNKNSQILYIQEKNIRQVLEFSGHKIATDYKLLDYIFNTHKDPLNNIIFYFYQENGRMKIICYDNYFYTWLINDFTEKEINLKKE